MTWNVFFNERGNEMTQSLEEMKKMAEAAKAHVQKIKVPVSRIKNLETALNQARLVRKYAMLSLLSPEIEDKIVEATSTAIKLMTDARNNMEVMETEADKDDEVENGTVSDEVVDVNGAAN